MTRAARFPAIMAASVLMAFPAEADDLQMRLQDLLDGFHAEYGFPGATAAVASPDGEVIAASTGLADVEAGTPMTPESRMLAASIGKSFVAAIVLALEGEGQLAQSDPLSDHLGDRSWFARLPNHRAMTIGDLLHHSAGIPDHVHTAGFAAAMAERMKSGGNALSPEAAIGFVLDSEPLFPSGAGWAYTDTGYLLLGLVIEQVTGDAYYDVVRDRLLGPLGLDATTPSDRRSLPGLAVGYTTPDNPFGIPPRTMDAEGRLLWDPAMEWTGGGLVSTSRDLAVWGHALFGGTALPEPYLDRLLDGTPVAPDAPGVLYGAGVAIYADTPRGPVWGHGGWIPGYVSSLRHYAGHGVTVAFQINTDVGIVDDSTDLVPALEAALADLAIGMVGGTGQP
jgi:D-alanyl-D-alanine carboxypeptidase